MESDAANFLGRPPSWLTRMGVGIVGGILSIIFLASFIISYSDVIEAEVSVMPISPPIFLKTNKSGQISEFFVHAGDSVSRGEIIAKLKTIEDYEDILAIKKAVSKLTIPEELDLTKPTSIGSLQEVYSEYLKAYYGIKTIEKFYSSKIENLLDDKKREAKGLGFNDVFQKLQASKRNNLIISQNHTRMRTLFDKGVISKSELEKSQMELNSSLQEINQLSDEYSKDSYTKNERFEGSVAEIEITSLKVLSEISIWEDQNIFTSPIDGKLFFLDIWSPFQSVKRDEELFGIAPYTESSFMAVAKIPIHNSGKVIIGQQAIIKLHGFPYEEWGTLEGTISEISKTPKQFENLNYIAYISIKSKDSYLEKSISEKGSLLGNCDIILKKNTLFEKVFFNVKKTINLN